MARRGIIKVGDFVRQCLYTELVKDDSTQQPEAVNFGGGKSEQPEADK